MNYNSVILFQIRDLGKKSLDSTRASRAVGIGSAGATSERGLVNFFELIQILAVSALGALLGYLLPQIGWDLARYQRIKLRFDITSVVEHSEAPAEPEDRTREAKGETHGRRRSRTHREVAG